ncbi:MAG TPA: hypothetical protein VGN51_07610 [Acidimicrobiia bacterium]|jgi:hypothetical protein
MATDEEQRLRRTLTIAQLRDAASGLSYRALQLTGVAGMSVTRAEYATLNSFFSQTIKNALIESSLTHARALAYFFTRQPHDVHFDDIPSDWKPRNEFVGLAKRISSPISTGHSHSQPGSPDGDPHPGEWPTVEMAVVLVGEFARFFTLVDPTACDLAWFSPCPVDTYRSLMSTNPLAEFTVVSDNEKVASLTESLRAYLRKHGPPTIPKKRTGETP